MLDSLHGAAQCPAVRSESIWLGTSGVLRGREFHVRGQNKSLLPAGSDDASLPAERVRPRFAVLPAGTVPGVLGRTA